MRSTTLLTAGSWALAILVGCFCWLSPDSPAYPGPTAAAVVAGAAVVLWLVGAIRTGVPRTAPRLSFRRQVGAIAPLLAATLGLILAGRGLLPNPALPLVFILIVGGAIWWWGQHGADTPSTPRQELGVALLFIPTVLVLIPVLMLAVWGQSLWLLGVPNYARAIDRYNSVRVLARYRPAPRAGITADSAGLALVAISNTGTTRREALLLDPAGSLPEPWLPDSGPFGRMTADSVMIRAIAGLTTRERSWLQQVGGHGGMALVGVVAYAPRLDPWAALKTPLPDDVNAFSLPSPKLSGVRDAAKLQLYRAALAMADRKPAVADSLVREVIGFGLRLHDDSDQLIGALVGTVIAREAGATLAELRAATGKGAEADSLRRALEITPGAPFIQDLDSIAGHPTAIRSALIDAILAHAAPHPVEWDLAAVLGIAPCTDLRELFYGPAPRLQAAYDAVGTRVEAAPHAQAAFAVIRRGLRGSVTAGSVPLLFRPATWALGHTNAGACVAVGSGM